MDKENPLKNKSYQFALKVLKLYRCLVDQREFILSKQLLKSGTSIVANVEEALQGQSKRDFIAKLSISLKEAYETHYWLRLLRDDGFLETSQLMNLIEDVNELIRLLTAIIKRTKSTLVEIER